MTHLRKVKICLMLYKAHKYLRQNSFRIKPLFYCCWTWKSKRPLLQKIQVIVVAFGTIQKKKVSFCFFFFFSAEDSKYTWGNLFGPYLEASSLSTSSQSAGRSYAHCQEKKNNQQSYPSIKPTDHNTGLQDIHKCNRNTYILGVTNSYLTELKSYSIGESSFLAL